MKLDEENIPQIEDLVSVCAGLITVDEDSSFVRLVHYTAQEYFERNRTYWFPNADEDIVTACITYLMFENLLFQHKDTAALNLQRRLNPLYDYAASHWGFHARNATRNSSKLEQLVIDFPKTRECIEALAQMQRRGLRPTSKVNLSMEDERAWQAALWSGWGQLSIIKLLLASGKFDPNRRDEDGQTPLFQAAREGNDDVVKLLLSSDKVNPNSEDCYSSTPLSIAARSGKEQVVKLLLMQKGIEFNSVNKFDRTPIFWVAIKGHSRIVKLLLEKYKDAGVFTCADDLPKAIDNSRCAKGHLRCNSCTMGNADAESHKRCEICQFVNFDICQQCCSLGECL